MFSLPTLNWLRWPGDDDRDARPVPIWPLERLLDAASSAGFRGVGLDHYTVRAYADGGGQLDALGELLAAHDLVCTDLAVLPIGTKGAPACAEALAQLASVTGARTCIAAHYRPLDAEQTVRELRACADVLAARGVAIALEFVSYGHLRTLAEAVEICAEVGWNRCRLLVDAWHFFRGDEPFAQLRSLDREQIGLLHVCDGSRRPDGDPLVEGRSQRLPVGAGAFPLAEFAAAVEATGYEGVVSTEVLSGDLRARPPEEGARLLMDALRDGWPA